MKSRFKAVAALALVIGVGVALPATAEADSASYTQLEICHTGAPDLNMYIVGYNQYGDWVTSYTAHIPPYGCYRMSNWWWQTNRSFELHWEVASTVPGWHWAPVYIPGTAQDGGWQHATIYE